MPAFIASLLALIARNMSKLEFGNTFDLKCAFEFRTVREFDDRIIIAPLSVYKDGNDYYTAATLHIKPLEKINVPLLLSYFEKIAHMSVV